MKDEIKEILEDIKSKYEDYYVQDIVSGNDLKLLLDYITNLQEENEKLKYQDKVWSGINRENRIRRKEYKQRIDKAIEYIEDFWKKNSYYEDVDNCLLFCLSSEFDKEDLLNILQGKSDE